MRFGACDVNKVNSTLCSLCKYNKVGTEEEMRTLALVLPSLCWVTLGQILTLGLYYLT